MKFITLSFMTLLSLRCLAQQEKVENPLDTINGVVFGSYPEIYRSNYRGLTDSLLVKFPNRSKVNFKDLSSDERDSLVFKYWNKFRIEFFNSIDPSMDMNKKTKSFFFTLHFDLDGKLEYVFYNWNKYPDFNESFNESFKLFTSQYSFKGFPQGKAWSQCGTFMRKRRKSKS